MMKFEREIASHITVHIIDPQTLAYGAHDSPIGMLAWILERRHASGDTELGNDALFTKDELLTLATLYWSTETFVNSVRFYAENTLNLWQPSHDLTPIVQVPTGFSTFLPWHVPRGATVERLYNVAFENEWDRGGHFAPAENPTAVVADIRDFFRRFR